MYSENVICGPIRVLIQGGCQEGIKTMSIPIATDHGMYKLGLGFIKHTKIRVLYNLEYQIAIYYGFVHHLGNNNKGIPKDGFTALVQLVTSRQAFFDKY